MEWLTVTNVLLAFLTFLLAYCIHYGFTRPDWFTPQGIPIARPLHPFIGNLWGIWKEPMNETAVRQMKSLGNPKIFGSYRGRTPVLVVADCDLIKDILIKDFEAFPNRPNPFGQQTQPIIRKFISTLENAEWKALRNQLSPMFSSGKLKKMVGLIDECNHSLIESFKKVARESGGNVEVRPQYRSFQLDVIATTAFGTKLKSLNDPENPFIVNANKIGAENKALNSPLILIPFIIPSLAKILPGFNMKVLDFFSDFVKKILSSRKDKEANSRGDMIDLMIEMNKLNPELVTEEVIIAQALIFLLAGNATAVNCLTWATYYLATNPDIQEQIHDQVSESLQRHNDVMSAEVLHECPYLEQFVMETLRIQAPAPAIERAAERDYDLHGIKIPKGATVVCPVHVIHHNPEYYPDPETFKLDRFSKENRGKIHPMAFLAFGAGPRNCIAMRLGLQMVEIALARIVQRLRFTKGTYNTYPIPPANGFSNVPADFHVGIEDRSESEA